MDKRTNPVIVTDLNVEVLLLNGLLSSVKEMDAFFTLFLLA